MARNPGFHSRTKNIALKHDFIHEAIKEREVDIKYCKSEEQVNDISTKALSNDKFKKLRNASGVQVQHIKDI